MVLTRRSAAALDERQLKETKEPEKHATEKEEGERDCTVNKEVITHADYVSSDKEDNESDSEREQMESDSLKSLTAAACSILRKARVDSSAEHVDSSDEETKEDCVMEAEVVSSGFVSLSGIDALESKSVMKKRRENELVRQDAY